MSTTTITVNITLTMPEQSDASDIKKRTIAVPKGIASIEEIKQSIQNINPYLAGTASTNQTLLRYARGIKATFQETVKDGAETYTYIPNQISKAEIVTITEDVIYGN